MDGGWLTTRNKSKVQPKPTKSKYRTCLAKQKYISSPASNFLLTQNSPPPKQLFSATKQSSLTQFFKPAGSYDDIQDVPYQQEVDESLVEAKYNSRRKQTDPQFKNEADDSDATYNGTEQRPYSNRQDVSNKPEQVSALKLEFQSERNRIKRKRASGIDGFDSGSDDENLRNSSNSSDIQVSVNLINDTVYHKRLKSLPQDEKDEGQNENNQTCPSMSESKATKFICMTYPTGDRNEQLFNYDFLKTEDTRPLSVHTMSKSRCHEDSVTDDSAKPVHSDNSIDKSGNLTFLHDHLSATPSLDFSVNAADSLDLETEFTLRSQREKYNALERIYQAEDRDSRELPLYDDFTCEALNA